MVRRPTSRQRSRRSPVLARLQEASLSGLPTASPPPPANPWIDSLPEHEPGDLTYDQIPLPPAPAPHLPAPARPANPSASHAPTGWEWFAQWHFPTQLFIFSCLLATGMWWLDRTPPSAAATEPAAPTRTTTPRRPSLKPEMFDWLNRLRETQVVTDQLEAEFTEAQQFYREYALDEFLLFDPWSLATDEVVTLTHFCNHGFFTVEREILVKILERKLLQQPETTIPSGGGASARLAAAAIDRETRLTTLREAAEMYRTGRSAEIMVPKSVTPEEDQAQRARLVDKLVAARRERDRLDSEIDRLNALLH